MIPILAFALIPLFFGLLLGYFAGIRKFVDNRDVHSLVRFVMNFALPCSLFTAIAHTEDVLSRMNGEDPRFLTGILMELLQEFKKGDTCGECTDPRVA